MSAHYGGTRWLSYGFSSSNEFEDDSARVPKWEGGARPSSAAVPTSRFSDGELEQCERVACSPNDVVQDVYAIGLRLHSGTQFSDASVSARLQQTIDDLDAVIHHLQCASLDLVQNNRIEAGTQTVR